MSEVSAHRAAIEKTIVRLAQRRSAIDVELQQLMAMLAIADRPSKKGGNYRPVKKPRQHALELLAGCDPKTGVAIQDLVKRTGQPPASASQTMRKLVAAGKAKVLSRGIYAPAGGKK